MQLEVPQVSMGNGGVVGLEACVFPGMFSRYTLSSSVDQKLEYTHTYLLTSYTSFHHVMCYGLLLRTHLLRPGSGKSSLPFHSVSRCGTEAVFPSSVELLSELPSC
jgi:hypothetical protein